ncbi:hypothetical protein [Guyparkeria sp.]|uniref:hypothetical protein n=1 Tax=Guyparkeria sp. TaxID=2035736 RepID=UPI003970E761
MQGQSQGFRDELGADPWLVGAWWTLGGLAWLSLGAVAAWGEWPGLAGGALPAWLDRVGRLVILLAGSWWVWRHLATRPVGLMVPGRLSWSGARGRFETKRATWRGEMRLVWRSAVLVGVRLRDPVRGTITLWLTPHRLGEAGWWRLQRFLVLGGASGVD